MHARALRCAALRRVDRRSRFTSRLHGTQIGQAAQMAGSGASWSSPTAGRNCNPPQRLLPPGARPATAAQLLRRHCRHPCHQALAPMGHLLACMPEFGCGNWHQTVNMFSRRRRGSRKGRWRVNISQKHGGPSLSLSRTLLSEQLATMSQRALGRRLGRWQRRPAHLSALLRLCACATVWCAPQVRVAR